MMKLLKQKKGKTSVKRYNSPTQSLSQNKCRCGGKPNAPQPIADCEDRWFISCSISRCYANNIGQGLAETIEGWNRLSTHFYR